jgi:outer membrane protein OmpA-like peptidoglycan-associated protein
MSNKKTTGEKMRNAIQKKMIVGLLVVAAAIQGCESAGKKTAVGAGVGVAAGALLGSVVGQQSGDKKKGAIAGAVLGGALGAAIGNRLDKQAKELEKVAETKRTEQGIVTQLKSDILFESGKADLKPKAIESISQLGDILKKYPENVITVKGHTDDQGSDDTNKVLSEKRAENVKSQLAKVGVPVATISIVGLGESTPLADNKTADGRSKNRRVEVEIAVDASKVPADAVEKK